MRLDMSMKSLRDLGAFREMGISEREGKGGPPD